MSFKQSTVLVFVLLTKKWFSVVFRHEQFLDTYQKMITILGTNVKKNVNITNVCSISASEVLKFKLG